MDLFSFYLKKLTEVSLSTPTNGLDLTLCERFKFRLDFCVNVVDQEILCCLLDILDLALEK